MGSFLILIAEDDADDRFLLKSAFEENGFKDTLHFVENGVELLDFLNESLAARSVRLPHFIMLDLNMPKKDGREVLKEIKTNPDFRKIPVIIFSTTNSKQEMSRCFELGANSYITKPNSYEQLIHTIAALRQYWTEINNYP
jgi:two-component system response regulator